MNKTTPLLAASLSLGLLACIPPNDDADPGIRRALPRAEDVEIRLPENAQKPSEAKAVGDLAAWYVVTREITRNLNGGTAWVLIVVHTVVQFPPTTVEGNTYTWGPWSGALDPAQYRLVVTDLENGSYGWTLDGDSKIDTAENNFETIISGTAWPGEVEGQGHGDFTIDFDAAERVNPVDNDAQGVVGIAYDLVARHLDMTIASTEDRDGVPTPVNYDYSYTEAADGGGDMVFQAHADTEDEGGLAEDAVVRSRWLASGDGRADVRLSSGDLLDLSVTASQCWDDHFGEVYYSDSAGFVPPSGAETDCAFATSDLPPL
jgi:hypothetical protein